MNIDVLKSRLKALQMTDELWKGSLMGVKRDIEIYITLISLLEENNNTPYQRIKRWFKRKDKNEPNL